VGSAVEPSDPWVDVAATPERGRLASALARAGRAAADADVDWPGLADAEAADRRCARVGGIEVEAVDAAGRRASLDGGGGSWVAGGWLSLIVDGRVYKGDFARVRVVRAAMESSAGPVPVVVGLLRSRV
jgi:hypothetical protein